MTWRHLSPNIRRFNTESCSEALFNPSVNLANLPFCCIFFAASWYANWIRIALSSRLRRGSRPFSTFNSPTLLVSLGQEPELGTRSFGVSIIELLSHVLNLGECILSPWSELLGVARLVDLFTRAAAAAAPVNTFFKRDRCCRNLNSNTCLCLFRCSCCVLMNPATSVESCFCSSSNQFITTWLKSSLDRKRKSSLPMTFSVIASSRRSSSLPE
mmetsp:Transcript_45796/g.121483  ORF Transcript_45796/g.121483 Transcript_45796/m.121483 type:complete len:214 (+) Transcript_45796:765-1406(+)